MGCFSFLCSTCEEPINSDSFSGEHCTLFLLEKGEILEWMQGQYDSYGRVFNVDTANLGPHSDEVSQLWETMEWGRVCNLIFDSDEESGIAAYHTECLPKGEHMAASDGPIVSDNDPEQGWGEYKYSTQGPHRHEIAEQDSPITMPPGTDGITWTKVH